MSRTSGATAYRAISQKTSGTAQRIDELPRANTDLTRQPPDLTE